MRRTSSRDARRWFVAAVVTVAVAGAACGGGSDKAADDPSTTTSAPSTTAPTTQPPTTRPPETQAPASRPTDQQIQQVMTRTVEVTDPSTHFAPSSTPITIPDGSGGNVTAVVGQRMPTAAAEGQVVFFWHDDRFIGWDSDYETIRVTDVAAGAPGEFRVSYETFGPNDPNCCPTLPPTVVGYRWNGSAFTPSGSKPNQPGQLQVKLT